MPKTIEKKEWQAAMGDHGKSSQFTREALAAQQRKPNHPETKVRKSVLESPVYPADPNTYYICSECTIVRGDKFPEGILPQNAEPLQEGKLYFIPPSPQKSNRFPRR